MMSRIYSWHWKISSGHLISDSVEFLRSFWKWRLLEIFQCRESNRDIIIYPHMKWRWNRTMLNLCGIDISYVGRLWCPKMIPDIEKCLPVAIFKMAVTIPHKFNIVRFQHPELITVYIYITYLNSQCISICQC
jgi:hypothetical protein